MELYQIGDDPKKVYTRKQLKMYDLTRMARDLEPGQSMTITCSEADSGILSRRFTIDTVTAAEGAPEKVEPYTPAGEGPLSLRHLLRGNHAMYAELACLEVGKSCQRHERTIWGKPASTLYLRFTRVS